MQGNVELHEVAAHRVVPVEPSSSLATLLFAASGATYVGANLLQTSAVTILGVAASAGLFCVGAYVLWLRYVTLTPHRRARISLDAVFGDGPLPAFATDRMGHVLHVNRAFMVGQHIAGRDVESCLSNFICDVGAVTYRLLQGLKGRSVSSEIVEGTDGTTFCLRVSSGDGNLLFWSLRPVERTDQTTSAVPSLATCPVYLSDTGGNILLANDCARLFVEKGMALPLPAVGDARAQHGVSGKMVRLGDKRFRLHSSALEGGRYESILVPVNPEELVVADPEQFYNTLPVAIVRIADDGQVIYANDAAVDLLGARARPGVRLSDLMEGLGRSIEDRISDMARGRSHMRSEVARAKVRGQETFLQVTLKRLLLNGDTTLLAVINDATELKTLEAQFVQSQKMHAVGQLAGGVAHDFNNLLTAINGHCDLVLMRHQPMDNDYGDLIQIRHNANRAASLVGQLLAFSRKQTLVPKVIDLYDTLSDLNHLLNRLLGEKVTLRIDARHDLPCIRADQRQLEQVIMNLVVNARDAMPDGGEVEIKATDVTFAEDTPRDNAVIPFGQYVQIDVSDTGVGIPADQIGKIFEPFYTTKKVGEGTGLGLSTAYGIIKQTGGFIFAQSEIGMGTTFTVYLPALTEEAQVAPAPRQEERGPQDLTGSGVVLLVEDEVPVRSFAARALTIRGYTVLEAASAEEALEILQDEHLHVDIFVSDVIMPGMDGPTWVRKAQETRPDAKVVFVSGYAEDAFEGGKIKVPNATFLPKPFSLNDLTLKVKEQLTGGQTIH